MPNIPKVFMQIVPESQVVLVQEKGPEGIELVDPVTIFIPFSSFKAVAGQVLTCEAMQQAQAAKNGIIKLHGKEA